MEGSITKSQRDKIYCLCPWALPGSSSGFFSAVTRAPELGSERSGQSEGVPACKGQRGFLTSSSELAWLVLFESLLATLMPHTVRVGTHVYFTRSNRLVALVRCPPHALPTAMGRALSSVIVKAVFAARGGLEKVGFSLLQVVFPVDSRADAWFR